MVCSFCRKFVLEKEKQQEAKYSIALSSEKGEYTPEKFCEEHKVAVLKLYKAEEVIVESL